MTDATTRYEAATARTGRVIVGRILPNSDLLLTLRQVCIDNEIGYAAVNIAFGTLSGSQLKHLDNSTPPKMVDMAIDNPVAFLGGAGLICTNAAGEKEAHFHGVLEQVNEVVRGGHLNEGGNLVYNTVDFVITELLGVELIREWDEETSTIEMTVRNVPE